MVSGDEVQFYFMHFMPYADIPTESSLVESVWVDYPNTNYDPEVGHQLYERYLGELVLADELGFDGVVVNEHHSTPYSMMPACTLLAAALAVQTRQAKICVFGTPVNLTYPNRLAEEYAMLDVLSKGRVELAFPLGTGMEYWSTVNHVNPTQARERFREALAVILQAWGDGPTSFDGEHYSYRYLNVWPKPYQRPHPPLYLMGSGSGETIELAAELGLGYSVTFIPIPAQLAAFERYREATARRGRTATPDQLVVGIMAYVGETDEEAEREGRPHILHYFNNAMRTTPRYLAPPGYVSLEEYRKRIERMLGGGIHGNTTWETLSKSTRVVCGSPDTVAGAIARWADEAGSSRINCHLHLGDMPHWKTVKNLTLFAEEVIPRVRALLGGGREVGLGYDASGGARIELGAGDANGGATERARVGA